jgi:hypothetical protein
LFLFFPLVHPPENGESTGDILLFFLVPLSKSKDWPTSDLDGGIPFDAPLEQEEDDP